MARRFAALRSVLAWGALLCVVFFFFFPILWLLLASIKSQVETFAIPPPILFIPKVHSYFELLAGGRFGVDFQRYLLNSLITSLGGTTIALFAGSLAGYCYSRFRFKGLKPTAFLLLAVRFLPPISTIIPLYLFVKSAGLYDNLATLALLYAALQAPIVTWMMKAFFDEVPKAVEEAALIDGCSRLGAFFRVALPLAAGGLAAAAIFAFIFNWGDFLLAFIFTSENAKTATVVLYQFRGETGVAWSEMAAGSALCLVPVLVFTWIVEKYLVKGLTLGAVKG
jgi:multiple sugar transport system permease protein